VKKFNVDGYFMPIMAMFVIIFIILLVDGSNQREQRDRINQLELRLNELETVVSAAVNPELPRTYVGE
jgi:hypothetical protein